jgi:hypothetical protein
MLFISVFVFYVDIQTHHIMQLAAGVWYVAFACACTKRKYKHTTTNTKSKDANAGCNWSFSLL